jgi:hypothetical protein
LATYSEGINPMSKLMTAGVGFGLGLFSFQVKTNGPNPRDRPVAFFKRQMC